MTRQFPATQAYPPLLPVLEDRYQAGPVIAQTADMDTPNPLSSDVEKDRRRFPRHQVFLPTELACLSGNSLALTQNASRCGLLLMTRKSASKGQTVEVSLLLGNNEMAAVRGTVVRVARIESSGLWRYHVAVAFESVWPDSLADRVSEASEKQDGCRWLNGRVV